MTSEMTQKLFKAAAPELIEFGQATFWATSETHAMAYLAMKGYGGPSIYRATVQITPSRVFDLRAGAWAALWERFRVAREDYEAGSDHDVFVGMVPGLFAPSFDWVIFNESSDPLYEEWLYCGDVPVRAIEISLGAG